MPKRRSKGIPISFLVFALLLLPVVLIVGYRTMNRVSSADVVWLVGAASRDQVPDDMADVATRYLARHRRHRFIGGFFGVCFAVIVGLRWSDGVGFGFDQGSPLADVLFCGVAGVLVGSLSAESHRLRSTSGPRAASLEPRAVAPHAGLTWAARVTLSSAVLAGLILLAIGAGSAALVSAAVGAVLVGTAELTRRRIVDRRRPARAERVDRFDRRLRNFAASSVAHLELAAAVLAAMWVLAWWNEQAPPGVVVFGLIGGVAGFIVVIVLLVRAAPRAPRHAGAAT